MNDIWHKTLVYFGFADEAAEVDYDEDEDEEEIFDAPPTVRKINRSVGSGTRARHQRTPTIKPVSRPQQAGVHVIEPKNFNDAQRIADKYKSDTPVILNLQQVEAELSKRLIDFASGLTYALDGGIQRVAEKVFLLTPKNIEVSAEERQRLKEKGFFNQF